MSRNWTAILVASVASVALVAIVGCEEEQKRMKVTIEGDGGKVRFMLLPELKSSFAANSLEWPEQGVIPDAETAAQVCYPILARIYGETEMQKQLPLLINLVDEVWIVRGALLPMGTLGGTAEMGIRKSTGEVVYVMHGV